LFILRQGLRYVPLLLAMLPGSVFALGFGDIRLHSALNAPLDADIDITATTEELTSLKATLASRDAFARGGLEYPAFLGTASIEVGKSDQGRDVLRLRTLDPVTEPFLTLLVQVNYARGQLVREYTVLLDPPVFAANGAAAAVSSPVAAAQSGELNRTPAPAPAPAPLQTPSQSPSAAAAGSGSYRVRRGDTLYSIAASQARGVPIDQALVAIYRGNPGAFDGNMNLLRSGALLAIPSESELAAVGPSEGRAEVARQYRSWAANQTSGRLRLVAPEDTGKQSTGSSAVAAAASTGAAPSSGSAELQQRINDLQQQLTESRRLLALKDAELARLQASAVKPALVPTPVAPTPVSPAPVAPAPAPSPEPTPQATAPPVVETPPVVEPMAAAMAPAVAPTAPARVEESFVGRAMSWLQDNWYVPVAAVLALLAAILGLRARRAREDFPASRNFDRFSEMADPSTESSQILPVRVLPETTLDSIVVEETGSHRRPSNLPPMEAPTVSTAGDLAGDLAATASTTMGMQQGDPLAEADFHMAYGLYDQAADLVGQAIGREPGRRDLKLKLLEVFFVWGNKDRFLEQANELAGARDQMGAGEWEKVVIMGRQIAPESELFAGTGGVAAAGASNVDLNLEGGQNRIDFNLLGEPTITGSSTADIDLDFNTALPDVGATTDNADSTANLEAGVDFLIDTPERGADNELHTRLMPVGEDIIPTERLRTEGLENEGPTAEMPYLDPAAAPGTIRMKLEGQAGKGPSSGAASDNTAELAIDDLGLDLGALEATGSAVDSASSTMETQIADLSSGPEGNWLLKGTEESSENSIIGQADLDDSTRADRTALDLPTLKIPGPMVDEVDFRLEATSIGPGSGGTSEITRLQMAGNNSLSDTQAAQITQNNPALDDTANRTADIDPPTMSEVGTKLDLARAYMDMGDPDGARSILGEVMAEGSSSQKQEARRLIDSLPG
jgi:pilus assembly protein FimV